MDPWNSAIKESVVIIVTPSSLKFEDNFSPALRHTLPDSDQYLAILEEKLNKIKNDPDILKQLIAKREACMQNLINNSTNFADETDCEFEAPLKNSASEILRTIAPQKQALTKGEIVELVQYDQLNIESESDGK